MYFNYLYDQFRRARGYENIDLNSMSFLNDFSSWLKEMQKHGETYIQFLNSIGLDIDHYDVAEIGKGKCDSIVQDLTTTIITPYPEGIDRHGFDYCRLITARFKVYNGKPALLMKGLSKEQELDTLSPSMFRIFMTQNPYSNKQIAYWDELHNLSDKDIIVGVFGNVHDKDKEYKLEQIREFRDKLYDSYNEDYTTEKDMYSYIISSDKSKKKKLTKRR